MKRRLLIGLLAAGTVAGYAAGFASLHRQHACRAGLADGFEARISRMCDRAAERAKAADIADPPEP